MSIPFHPARRGSGRMSGLLSVAAVLALMASTLVACAAHAPCHQSPWLARYVCEPVVISKVPYASLKQRLTDYVEQKKTDGVLIDAGIYFRDLESGPHFGVNEYANYAAASLLKLPLVVQYLMLAEEDPGLLKLQLVVPPGMDPLYNVIYRPSETLIPGSAHSVDDLLHRTMAYSDNVSFMMLRQYLIDRYGSESFILESYRQLGLVPEVVDRDPVISVSRYASMFKLIHSASVLSANMSEKLVLIMAEPGFDVGLVRGVPKTVPVAHKFGEMARDDVVQLHDCGIVYFPDNPYVLCVMTRGHTHHDLEKIIGEISGMVYAEVDGRRINKR